MNLELEETVASFTTQQTMHYEFGHELTTQFQLGECHLSEALTTKAPLQKCITEWNGELKTPSKKPPLSSLLAAHLPTAKTNYQQLINGMTASSKPTTEHNIELLNTLLNQIDGAPRYVQFQCLSQIESLAHTLQGQLTELKSNGHYRGVNLKYLFTSKSIWNTQAFGTYEEKLNRILECVHDLRYSGTKLEKSGDQQYTIIEGVQGNRYELLTHLCESEADSLGIAHFLTEKYSL